MQSIFHRFKREFSRQKFTKTQGRAFKGHDKNLDDRDLPVKIVKKAYISSSNPDIF